MTKKILAVLAVICITLPFVITVTYIVSYYVAPSLLPAPYGPLTFFLLLYWTVIGVFGKKIAEWVVTWFRK